MLCLVTSPALSLAPSATSLSSRAKARRYAPGLSPSLCVPTLGEQTPLRPSSAPSSAHPRGAASASACNRRAGRKTAAAALSCICHNCDLMEQSENASTRFGPGCCAHTPAIVLSAPSPASLLAIRPQPRRHTTRVFIISLISQRSDLFAPLSTRSVLRV